MSLAINNQRSHTLIHLLVALAGSAALSWQILWQVKSSLALGVSAWGTAITLAATMGGLSIGAWLMGEYLKRRPPAHPVRLYGLLEIVIGISGLFLGVLFQKVENLDTAIYQGAPESTSLVHILGIVAVLGLPTMCMGATVPVFGLIAQQYRTSIAALYGLNTLGAAAGCLLAAFAFIPTFGIAATAWVIAAINFIVGAMTWILAPVDSRANIAESSPKPTQPAHVTREIRPITAYILVFVTGFATLSLEVAWFRSLVSTFQSTTAAFAVMLSALLLSLGAASWLVPYFKRAQFSLGTLLSWAGILILVATPILERLDLLLIAHDGYVFLNWFILTLLIIGGPVLLLGIALPWILEELHTSRDWGKIYAVNTLASIAGSLSAAWLLLPTIGFVRTACLIGSIVFVTGIFALRGQKRWHLAVIGTASLLLAFFFESGIGKTRVQGWAAESSHRPKLAKILGSYEGPDATTTAVEYVDKTRALYINGFEAAGEVKAAHYMVWMGHLPMLIHPAPKQALVICFGTGQTANAVRQEKPETLDIVDINPRVPMLAPHFPSNQGVLHDPRVKLTIMDGRAFIRRTTKAYDVITLEPMPPSFAGVNALYSKEFYQHAWGNLGAQGVIAQWLPFHLVSLHYMRSIVKTFTSVFPNAILWIDPPSKTGILVGTKQESMDLMARWPGFSRDGITRDLSEKEAQNATYLNASEVKLYAEPGEIITDDNQRLNYGKALDALYAGIWNNIESYKELAWIKNKDLK